jgi:hypothetical protein
MNKNSFIDIQVKLGQIEKDVEALHRLSAEGRRRLAAGDATSQAMGPVRRWDQLGGGTS